MQGQNEMHDDSLWGGEKPVVKMCLLPSHYREIYLMLWRKNEPVEPLKAVLTWYSDTSKSVPLSGVEYMQVVEIETSVLTLIKNIISRISKKQHSPTVLTALSVEQLPLTSLNPLRSEVPLYLEFLFYYLFSAAFCLIHTRAVLGSNRWGTVASQCFHLYLIL